MEGKRNSTFIFLIIGLIGSIFFAFAGYLIGGAMGIGQEQGIGFGNALISVLADPFGKYFNNYTPITILLGFIVFESVFILFFFMRKKEDPINEEEYKPSVIDLVDLDESIIEETVRTEMTDKDLFGGVASGAAVAASSDKNEKTGKEYVVSAGDNTAANSTEGARADEVNEKVSFGSEIMDEMLGDHYSLEQMVAMINIKKYMNDVSADLLKRMFSPDMSPEDILSYISLFYE